MTGMRFVTLLMATLTVVLMVPTTWAARDQGPIVEERIRDDQGRVVYEFGHEDGRPEISFARHYFHRPGHTGGGGGGGGTPLTDCAATNYRLAPWHWDQRFSATASRYADVFQTGAMTWDDATQAGILAGVSTGSEHVAGVQDYHSQFDFVWLGASSTIAVTTTWYYTWTGIAIESDAQYNDYYGWSTDRGPGTMDVLNIATHELGHTFGLDHPNGNPGKISCLTMYAYGSEGEIAKRDLGDGDLLGIRAKYGA